MSRPADELRQQARQLLALADELDAQPSKTPQEKLVSVGEALAAVPVGRSTLLELAQRGQVPHYKAGRRVLFRISELVAHFKVEARP